MSLSTRTDNTDTASQSEKIEAHFKLLPIAPESTQYHYPPENSGIDSQNTTFARFSLGNHLTNLGKFTKEEGKR